MKTLTARQAWNKMYARVLNGEQVSPRGRKTVEARNIQFVVHPHQHLDPRVGRDISLDYIRREFLWYMLGNRYDTRITNYAPIWKTCISKDGGINSNYGQYLFKNEIPFFKALDFLVKDDNSRRCWIPIINTQHIIEENTNDVPCHTGIGFRLITRPQLPLLLDMSVHHRSLDMWHGAANDFPIAFMWQLLAQAYLKLHNIDTQLGTITHNIESAHFYERHIEKAKKAIMYKHIRIDVHNATYLLSAGFEISDIQFFFGQGLPSNVVSWILEIKGAYGKDDISWSII